MLNFFTHFIALFVESAPWLLLGFVVAGLIKTFVPQDMMSRQLGGSGLWVTVKAALIGAPLPLCSCGVVPAALGLRRSGASKNATVSFLVATPETGVDSIAVTYALLGPVMAVVRPVAAVFSGILSGFLVGRGEALAVSADANPALASSGGGGGGKAPVVVDSCCAAEGKPGASVVARLADGLAFSFHDMLRDISLWLLVGLLFAAAVQTWVPSTFLSQWGGGFVAFVVMAAIGVPMYICATASTPIAAGLLMAGVSPGAVLVFMMAGPATNLGTLAIVGRELGRRALLAYLSGVLIASFLFGYLLNLFISEQGIDIAAQVHDHVAGDNVVGHVAAVVLALAMARIGWISLQARLSRGQPGPDGASGGCCSQATAVASASSPSKAGCCSQSAAGAASATGSATGGCCSQPNAVSADGQEQLVDAGMKSGGAPTRQLSHGCGGQDASKAPGSKCCASGADAAEQRESARGCGCADKAAKPVKGQGCC